MNEFPEAPLEDITLSPKMISSSRTRSARASVPAQCVEGEHLKQQYDFALDLWRKQPQPEGRPSAGAAAHPAFKRREEALTERNAAANRMYMHRASCAICRRRR
jgi:hypothetical protein